MKDTMIIIDNGHGVDTPGKRSPDGSIEEWKYTREIAKGVYNALKEKGYNPHLLVPEDDDVSLSDRTKWANSLYSQNGDNAILVSIHLNAAGSDGEWHSARGWSVYISNNASQKSKTFATNVEEAAENEGLKIRLQYSSLAYWTQNLAICRDTKCPAILTENLFMDNKEDAEYLLSDEGKEAIIRLHVNGIINYISE